MSVAIGFVIGYVIGAIFVNFVFETIAEVRRDGIWRK